jgi:hypothetical protein
MRVLAGTAAALAVLAAPSAFAQTGHVGVHYGNSSIDDTDADSNAFGVDGKAAVDLGGEGLGLQVDGAVDFVDSEGDEATLWGLNGHLFFGGDTWRLGGVAGTGNIEFDGGGEIGEWYAGGEGQVWFDRAVLSGSATWGNTDDFPVLGEVDTQNLDGHFDFYPTDNLVFGGTLAWGNLEALGGDVDTSALGVSGEFQFSDTPFSIAAGYRHWELDDTGLSVDSFVIGGRFNFGGTLMARDKAGFRHSPGGVVNRLFGGS